MKREDGRQQVLRTGEKYSIAGPVLCGDPTEVHAPTSRRFSGKGVMRGSGLRSSGVQNGSPKTGPSFLGCLNTGSPKTGPSFLGCLNTGFPKGLSFLGRLNTGSPKTGLSFLGRLGTGGRAVNGSRL